MGERNDAVSHSTEDKNWWCQHGEELEKRFVDLCCNRFDIEASLNPDKKNDPYAPDLLVNGVLSDLKVQNTPFFTAGRYGLDPRYTVTFNRKDYERYSKLYPNIDIYYWVDWQQTQFREMSIGYLGGVFFLPFNKVAQLIEMPAPEHNYIYRRMDTKGNAKSSFLLDIRQFKSLFCKPPQISATYF